jgi:pimeloyl-ACP methyl ester carboxylesterase
MGDLPAELAEAFSAAARGSATVRDQLVFATRLISRGCFRHARGVLDAMAKGATQPWWGWLIPRCDELIAGDALLEQALPDQDDRETARLPDGTIVRGASNIMVARRPPQARKAVLVCGTPNALFHSSVSDAAVFRSNAAHLVFLRDARPRRSVFNYLADVPGLGSNYAATLTSLRRVLAALGASEVFCAGLSLGGHAALRLGLDLEARAVLGLCPMTTLDPEDYDGVLAPQRPVAQRARAAAPDMAVDLAPHYQAAARRPRVVITYGEGNEADRLFASRMADVPDVDFRPIPGWNDHSAPGHELLLEELVFGARSATP